MHNLSLYVGCGLTHAPENFRDEVATLKDTLRATYKIFDFIGLQAGTAIDVYRHDMRCVTTADMFLGIVDYPSTGLGQEIERARMLDKPTLLVAHSESTVTRMSEGLAEDLHVPTTVIARYANLVHDIPGLIEVHLLPMVQ